MLCLHFIEISASAFVTHFPQVPLKVMKPTTSLTLLVITTLIGLFISSTLSNPHGFLNINCGASKNETDNDDLYWISDYPFIKHRDVATLSIYGDSLLPYRSVAYFTNLAAKKYCYSLPVMPRIVYLMRVEFSPGNFIDLGLASTFDLVVGGIQSIKLNMSTTDAAQEVHFEEIIFTPKTHNLSVCLARNSQTENDNHMFISVIALRQLEYSMYNSTDFNINALLYRSRRNFGFLKGDYIDYPEDPFDRTWISETQDSVEDISTNKSLGEGLRNQPPVGVLRTAITSTAVMDSISISLEISHIAYNTPASYYFAFYFCNIINQTKASLNSTFQVLVNGYEATDSLQFTSFLQCQAREKILQLNKPDSLEIVLQPTYGSDMGPFINAAEVYEILKIHNMTHPQDAIAIQKIAETMNVPDDLAGGDPCFPQGYSSSGIVCSKDIPPRVVTINLTNMGLIGNISPSISSLTSLTQLLLGNNSLSGFIPDLSSLKNLKTLHLQNNQLTGGIPSSLEKLPMLEELFLQNNKLDPSLPLGLINKTGLHFRVVPQSSSATDKKGHKIKGWVIGLLISGSVLLLLIFISATWLWRHRYRSQTHVTTSSSPHPQYSFPDENHNEHHRLAIEYTEKDIKAATNNFSTVIGHGGFGSVFYGRLSGYDVAVKILSTTSNQGQQEFRNEVTLLSRIYHKNLVKLMGFCRQPVALVYEYMHCGSLKDHLYGITKLEKPLDWRTRLSIVLEAAQGLLYLHQGCNPPIIHTDIKSNNILLNSKMSAKVADFGLSKLLDSSQSYISTNVKGTIGYLDPEYFGTSSLNEKSDVYSFGVVLLQVISGISPKEGIVELARNFLSCGRLVELMDSSLGGRYDSASAWKIAEIAYTCVQPQSINRPKMSMVVKELEEAVALTSEDNTEAGYSESTSFHITEMPRAR